MDLPACEALSKHAMLRPMDILSVGDAHFMAFDGIQIEFSHMVGGTKLHLMKGGEAVATLALNMKQSPEKGDCVQISLDCEAYFKVWGSKGGTPSL